MKPPAEEKSADIDRRAFLGWAIALMGGAVAATLGGLGLGYFISPALRRQSEDQWVDVGAPDDFPLGVPTLVDFTHRRRDAWVTTEEKSSAWILTIDGKNFVAYDPHCTHLGCPYRWNQTAHDFQCPCHGGVFDINGNVVAGPPPRPLDRYPVQAMNGRLMLQVRPVTAKA